MTYARRVISIGTGKWYGDGEVTIQPYDDCIQLEIEGNIPGIVLSADPDEARAVAHALLDEAGKLQERQEIANGEGGDR